jgi:hypothetical protein
LGGGIHPPTLPSFIQIVLVSFPGNQGFVSLWFFL